MVFYSYIELNLLNKEWTIPYIKEVTPIVNKYGGEYIARTVNHKQIEGDSRPCDVTVMIKWPSKEAFDGLFSDPEYEQYFKLRKEGAITKHFLVEGVDDWESLLKKNES